MQKGVASTFPSRIIARKQLSSLHTRFSIPTSGEIVELPESSVEDTVGVEVVFDVETMDVVLEKPVCLGTKQEHAELIPEIGFGVHIEA